MTEKKSSESKHDPVAAKAAQEKFNSKSGNSRVPTNPALTHDSRKKTK